MSAHSLTVIEEGRTGPEIKICEKSFEQTAMKGPVEKLEMKS